MSALPNYAPACRPMRPEDLDRVCAIERRIYAFPWSQGNFADSLTAGYLCTVMECAGTLVGYGVLTSAAGEAHLLNLSIDAPWQGQGLGRALLMYHIDLARSHDARIVLQREPHRGKGAAVRAGLLRATAGLRFMCDADLSMPVAEIPRFLAIVPSRCDIAIGTREGVGARRVGEPAYRHLLGRAFNTLTQALVLPGIHDTQCGFKLFTAEAVEAIFSRTTLEGWAFDVEALFIARRLGLRVEEVPVEWHFQEQSRVSAVRDPLRMLRDLRTIRRNARRGMYERSAVTAGSARVWPPRRPGRGSARG